MAVTSRQSRLSNIWKILLHVFVWCTIFVASQAFLFFLPLEDDGLFWRIMLINGLHCCTFYLNYLWLIPHHLAVKRCGSFILYNSIVLCLIVGIMAIVYQALPVRFFSGVYVPLWPILMRDAVVALLFIGVSIAVHFSTKWHKAEEARQAAEMGRTVAELQHLRNQLNPHFLLNTLNNIYALIAFDSERAQASVLDLSTMLRYVLYENNTERTPLTKEIDFLHKYITLMKIRLAGEVDVRFTTEITQPERVYIAPLIFISLVENAFKHGVSSRWPSFIHISLRTEEDHLVFECRNSNHPKDEQDHSGSGIGLQQVAQRLRFSYPDSHHWHHGVDEATSTYYAILKIRL